MPFWSSLLWRNSIYLRGRFLGELLNKVMNNKLV